MLSSLHPLTSEQAEHLPLHRPIIVDDNYESPETVALHEEGYEALVARAGSPPELMSAYGKPAPNHHNFDGGRQFSEGSLAFGPPGYGSQPSTSPSTTATIYQNPSPNVQMGYNANASRGTYDDQAGPYLSVSTPVPQITTYTQRGARGDKFTVNFACLYELQTSTGPILYLAFGTHKCQGSFMKLGTSGATGTYSVTAIVPDLPSTTWNSTQVPVTLFIENGEGDVLSKVEVGMFTLVENVSPASGHIPQDGSRKRKVSMDSGELMRSPVKRVSSQQLRVKDEYGAYNYTSDGNAYSPYLQASNAYGQTQMQPRYNQPTGGYQTQAPARNMPYNYASSATAASPLVKTQSPTWSPAYLNSPGIPNTTYTATYSRPQAVVAKPNLVRTSTLQNTPSPSSAPNSRLPIPQYGGAFTPAKLDIHGDLNSMTHGWSAEEWEAKRRLVMFRKSQSGSVLTTTFQAVSAEERPPNSVCISCILWGEKNECFVTSVDTIYLLEHLVDAKFTVEEKNRIRRNLEGFKPVTVSKGKPDSEEFFKVIMAFPHPKPRNIEKDVKVFKWNDLGSALKKIINKYSATAASVLPRQQPPPLLTPSSSTSYGMDGSQAGISYVSDHHGLSPRTMSGSTASSAFAGSMPSRVISPHTQKMPHPGPPDLRNVVPLPHPHETLGQWQDNHMPAPQHHQMGGHPNARPSWDMSFLDNGPATAGGTQSLNYPNSRNISDASVESKIARNVSQRQSQQMPRT